MRLRGVAFHHSVTRDAAGTYLKRWEPVQFDGPYCLPCVSCNAEFIVYFPKYADEAARLSYADLLRTRITEGCEKAAHPNTIVELNSLL